MTSNSTTTTSSTSYTINNPAIQYGWKCPVCGAVMAPWQNSCVNCSKKDYTPPHIDYEPVPWWANPQFHWDITCQKDYNTVCSSDKFNNTTITASNTNLNYKELLNNNLEKMKKNI